MNPISRRSMLTGCAGWAGASLLASTLTPALARETAAPQITATDLGGLWLLQGAGCNVLAVPGRDGALMVDGGLERNAAALVGAVLTATGSRRIHTLVNTHWHPEQTGSNAAIGNDQSVILAHEKTRLWLGRTSRARWFEGTYGPLPERARPNKTVRTNGTLESAGWKVDYGYLPQAHTDGDLYVYFPQADVLAAGGPVAGDGWPILDIHNGAWMGGLMKGHESLLRVTGPATRVVTAHGDSLLTRADLERHHKMYETLYDRLMTALNKGMGPDDVVDQRTAKEYEAEMGDASRFLDSAFRSLLLAYSPD